MARDKTLAAHIATSLRAARKRAALTQDDAAKAIGATQASISLWESGGSTPTLAKAFALAGLYGVSLDELLGHPVPATPEGA